MRIPPNKLVEITGYKTPSAQVRWFREYLGADVPRDRHGPILTDNTYELLMARRLGVLAGQPAPTAQNLSSANTLLPRDATRKGPKLLRKAA